MKVAELTCPVALHTAVSTSDRLSFHTFNRATGHRVRRQFVDRESGEVVEPDNQVKGYEIGQGEYIVLEPSEIAAVVPESDKTLFVQSFIPCGEIDDVYFDRPYYLTPSGGIAQQAFMVLREGMRQQQVVALAQALLFRRMRTLVIRSHEGGMIATTLNFDYEVRSAEEVFRDVPKRHVGGEMLDLARHIIDTKQGKFDPSAFDDRYESALADLVRAKLAGKSVKKKPVAGAKVIDLIDALRQSAAAATTGKARGTGKSGAKPKEKATAAPPRKPRSSARSSRRKAS